MECGRESESFITAVSIFVFVFFSRFFFSLRLTSVHRMYFGFADRGGFVRDVVQHSLHPTVTPWAEQWLRTRWVNPVTWISHHHRNGSNAHGVTKTIPQNMLLLNSLTAVTKQFQFFCPNTALKVQISTTCQFNIPNSIFSREATGIQLD